MKNQTSPSGPVCKYTIPEKCIKLYELLQKIDELESYIMRFIVAQKESIENKENSEGTLCNYIKACIRNSPRNLVFHIRSSIVFLPDTNNSA